MRKLVRRVRRKMWGGRLEMRIYDDATCRIRVDHPSNDPAIEMAMIGEVASLARSRFKDLGYELTIGPAQWRDDA